MTQQPEGRGRARNPSQARETILDAAETIFAEHGFEGARFDAIALASGYNKSLLWQYFGSKHDLYIAVLRRIDSQLDNLMTRTFDAWLTRTFDETALRSFLQTLIETSFDYFVAHPQFLRILTWEMAAGWSTYLSAASQFESEDSKRFITLFNNAENAHLLRSNLHPTVQFTFIVSLCQAYVAWLPVFRMLAQSDNSGQELARAKKHITTLVIDGMLSH